MARLAVFCAASLRRTLTRNAARGLAYSFFANTEAPKDLDSFDGVLLEVGAASPSTRLLALRRAAGRRPVGGILVRPDAAKLARARRAGFDFLLEAWGPGDPPGAAVLAHLAASRTQRKDPSSRDVSLTLKRTAKRLAILTDIVKTANSILEPRKVIELVVEKIRQLIPSEAWSLLMVDEEKQELVFEAALGAKGRDVTAFRLKMGEGVAGWVAQTGEPAIVNDAARDPRFTGRVDSRTQFRTRSILCAPLVARGRTIGVLEIINKLGGRFTRADLALVLMLVEPCAIAIENAVLFQRTEQLTITDDLTRLFNSRYLNLYLGREIKRCKRHGIPLSVIFLDLDGFKNINDQFGHLAGSGTLTEVGGILAQGVRESDIIARYGGDEFVVVLPETPASGALVIAERLRRAIEEHRFLEAQGISARISASFGIATYPDHALSPEGLIQKADQAMYRVKEREKNGIEVAV